MCNLHVRWWHVKLPIKSGTDFEPGLSRCLLAPISLENRSRAPGRHAVVSHRKSERGEVSCCGEVCGQGCAWVQPQSGLGAVEVSPVGSAGGVYSPVPPGLRMPLPAPWCLWPWAQLHVRGGATLCLGNAFLPWISEHWTAEPCSCGTKQPSSLGR